ncbi:hypothetical protein BAUCODRAFT_119594 [Baudoinia panamericana UAMH 10762]|uniref:Phosphatidate phosphatase APP1 catalytic domain-containing protein n=1 Tax=Baudoinia panamericana (strain UAMH 10762) TaxID=717646 RepID=M2LZD4_BAUPA|nr:uncharacterized protein BAUCODRAFT_119594 [Baudoinia panamericana UAMH 10762]EMD00033.1 hypothetical protein BAUCODRAFT_119594 [Baudoinia panamericana UAMH 10762]
MDFLREVVDQGRRAAVDALSGGRIEKDSPFSPEVPDDLRGWLPDLFDRFPIVFPWERPKPIDPAVHNVWILDNTAFKVPQLGDIRHELADPNVAQPQRTTNPQQRSDVADTDAGAWEVEFVACYFIKNSGRGVAGVTAALIKQLQLDEDDVATKKRIASRLEPFLDTVLPRHTVRISIDNQEEQTLGPSSYSGISSALHQLHFKPSSAQVTSNTLNLPPPFGLPSRTVLGEEQGWAVISDIDDTIKITQTPSPIGILQNTFTVETPAPVAGMPELYAHIRQDLDNPTFFYLSASPYSLYPFLRQFRDAHYPLGTLILRDASWQNLGGLIMSLQQNTKEYKDDRIAKIHGWFPQRDIVCIGDSTQSDPEAYGEAARRYPGWIKAIFIRKVTGIAGMDEEKKNASERFESAFTNLDKTLWHVFVEPSEVAEKIDKLVRTKGIRESGD